MYAWFATGWAYNKKYGIISEWTFRSKDADIETDKWDSEPEVRFLTVLFGILGI